MGGVWLIPNLAASTAKAAVKEGEDYSALWFALWGAWGKAWEAAGVHAQPK